MSSNRQRTNYQQGQAVIVLAIFLVLAAMAVINGFIGPVVSEARVAKNLYDSKRAYYLAESGIEDAVYRLSNNLFINDTETLNLDGGSVQTVLSDDITDKIVESTASQNSGVRKLRTALTTSSGASFNFGIQTDQGGFILNDNAEIHGNVYANGTVEGSRNNWIRGDVVSAGAGGLVSGFHATGSVYAHEVRDMIVDKDAYYQVIDNGSQVAGTKYPNTPDQATSQLPIPDAKIEEWKTEAASGGTTNCSGTLEINTDNIIIGPQKYTCNIELSGNQNTDVYLGGNIWSVGNIEVKQGLHIRIAQSLGNKSVALIADNPDNRATSSKITVGNNGNYHGNGPNSYVMLLSQNNSAENGGSEVAINMNNNATGAIMLYAGHGEVKMYNNGNLRQVTGYRIRIGNNAIVRYETGMVSLLFTAGPGGSWKINSWKEVE